MILSTSLYKGIRQIWDSLVRAWNDEHGTMRMKSHLCHRFSPRSQGWPLTIQSSAQMYRLDVDKGGSHIGDLPRFHIWLMGWTTVPPTKSGEIVGLWGGGARGGGWRGERWLIQLTDGHCCAICGDVQNITEYTVLELRQEMTERREPKYGWVKSHKGTWDYPNRRDEKQKERVSIDSWKTPIFKGQRK